MKNIIERVQQALDGAVDAKTLATSHHYFKEGERAKTRGAKMPEAGRIAKAFLPEIKLLPKADVWALCETLWQSGYLEDAAVACAWSDALRKRFEPADFEVFERWVDRYVDNWAACDTLCNHTVGDFVTMYPAYVERLKAWAVSENRWMRRAAAVTLIIPARRGLFFDDILQIATTLLEDGDHMVQKGYGWMLKAASEAHQREVFDYVTARRTTMPRTALRYAIEKMPPELRAEAMRK